MRHEEATKNVTTARKSHKFTEVLPFKMDDETEMRVQDEEVYKRTFIFI